LEKGLLHRDNVSICEVAHEDFIKAVSIAENHKIGANDAAGLCPYEEKNNTNNLLL